MESGKDKVRKICDILRKETLDPAKMEAEEIVQAARDEAEKIIAEARREAEHRKKEADKELERQRAAFQASISQACRQAVEVLKQSIEEKLFSQELSHLIGKQVQDPHVLAKLIDAVIRALEKEGVDAELSAYVTAAVPARAVNELLAKDVLERLKEKSVLLGPMAGGASVKLHGKNITLDISDAALKDLVAQYIRKDFRDLFLGAI